MSAIIYCERCNTKQPNNWQQGDLCIDCGGAVRKETRCTWCTKLTPENANFCKHCGSKVFDEKWFASARILKNFGVSQPELAELLPTLSNDRITNYHNIYNNHIGVLEYLKNLLLLLQEYYHLPLSHAFLQIDSNMLPKIPLPASDQDKAALVMENEYSKTTLLNEQFPLHISEDVTDFIQLAKLKTYPLTYMSIHKLSNIFMLIGNADKAIQKEAILWFAHPNSHSPYMRWDGFEKDFASIEKKYNLKPVAYFVEVATTLLDIPAIRKYAAVALCNVLYKTNYQHPIYNHCLTIAEEYVFDTDANLALTIAFIQVNYSAIQTVACYKTTMAYTAFLWLLYNNADKAKKCLSVTELSKYQLLAIEEYLVVRDAYYAKRNETGQYHELFNYAANLLLKQWQKGYHFNTPLNQLDSNTHSKALQFMLRFAKVAENI